MNILVSGANGFLAGHVISHLCAQGIPVRAMMRKQVKAPALEQKPVEIFYGNITDKADLQQAIRGITHVIHTAADTRQSHRHLSDYYPVNAEATKMLLECAISEGCSRFIFISSANTIGYGTKENPGTEINKPSSLFCKSGYASSKMMAENIILQEKYLKAIDIIILNPSFLIGPEDHNPHSGRIFNMILNKKLVFYPPGGKNFIDVRDAADAAIAAIHKGTSGERYLLTGSNLSYKDFFNKVVTCSGQKKWMFPIPETVLITAGIFGSIIRSLGVNTSLSLTNMRILCIGNYYGNQKARSALGLKNLKFIETLSDSIIWKSKTYNKDKKP